MTGAANYGISIRSIGAAPRFRRERIQWIQADRWIGFDRRRGFVGLARSRLSARDRMPCLLIFGDTGMGKTKIIRKFVRDIRRRSVPGEWRHDAAGGGRSNAAGSRRA